MMAVNAVCTTLAFSIDNILKVTSNGATHYHGLSAPDDGHGFGGRYSPLYTRYEVMNVSPQGDEIKRPRDSDDILVPSPASSTGSPASECSFDEGPSTKRKKCRTSFSVQQVRDLESYYRSQRYLPANERSAIASRLRLSDQQVKTWFQNRRMKEKRHAREMADTVVTSSPPVCTHTSSPTAVTPLPAFYTTSLSPSYVGCFTSQQWTTNGYDAQESPTYINM